MRGSTFGQFRRSEIQSIGFVSRREGWQARADIDSSNKANIAAEVLNCPALLQKHLDPLQPAAA